MEMVCLILGPTLTCQPCSHAFWVLTSLHLPSFLLKMFLLFLYIVHHMCVFMLRAGSHILFIITELIYNYN